MTAEQVIAYVQGKLHEGPCPGKGALGELCYLNSDPIPCTDRATMHDTHMAVWRDSVTPTEVAGWFKEAGASQVFISAWLHCEDNTRAWDITFWLPGDTATASQPTTSQVTP